MEASLRLGRSSRSNLAFFAGQQFERSAQTFEAGHDSVKRGRASAAYTFVECTLSQTFGFAGVQKRNPDRIETY